MPFYLRTKQESSRLKRRITNRTILGLFLIICVGTVVLKIVDGILLDLGYRNNEVHLGFWSVENAKNWIDSASAEDMRSALNALARHPNSIWFLTQFTYITTIIIILYLTIRFFEIGDSVPKWLRWVMTQRTLTLITIYDLIVGIVFWTGLARNFLQAFSSDLRVLEILITVLVHALIPVLITVFALIFLIRDPKAALLKARFVGRALIYPACYGAFYILLTLVWDDPYQVTSMHAQLVRNDANSWNDWASELWKFPLAFGAIYVLIGVFTTAHNFILLRFNKFYALDKDVEMHERYNQRVNKIERLAMRDFKRKHKR